MPQARNAQVEEIIRCGKDPVHFTNKWLKITHPEKGLIGFKTFPFQDDCLRDFKDNRFNIVLKSRQLGLSTITAAYALWLAIFHKEKNILVIATKMAVAQNFVRKVKTMLENLPPWLLIPKVSASSKQAIEFSNGSVVKAIPTSEDAGRSEALSLLIIDEAAFIRNFEELWKGLYPTLSTGGSAVILSTPNGVGNQYHKLWVDAETGTSNFHAIKLPWDVHPERDQSWFDTESRQMSRKQIAQELLCDFSSSGDTFITNEDMDRVRTMTRSPIERWGPDQGVWVWKYALTDRKYVIGADISRGDSGDFSTAQVIDTSTCEQVAEFRGKVPPDQFGILLNEIGMRYNKALIAPENNTYGFSTITKLRELGYPNLYMNDRRYQYAVDIPVGKFGWNTSSATRTTALTKLEELVRNGSLKLSSSRVVDEFKTFMWFGDSPRAQKGFHDDLIMALSIAINLFDFSVDSSKSVGVVSKALLAGFGVNKSEFVPPPVYYGDLTKPRHYDSRMMGGNPDPSSSVPTELQWLYK